MPKSLIIFVAGVGTGVVLSSLLRHESPSPPKAEILARSVETELQVPVVAPKGRPRAKKKSGPAPKPAPTESLLPERGSEVCLRSVSEYLGTRPSFGDITCRCPAEAAESGTVWGTGMYTTDSSLCRAAKHAGRWRDDGDEVTFFLKPGMAHYEGSESDGVKSEDYGAWESSFSFYP